MSAAFISHLQSQIEATKEDGLYKKERVITSNNKQILVLLVVSMS